MLTSQRPTEQKYRENKGCLKKIYELQRHRETEMRRKKLTGRKVEWERGFEGREIGKQNTERIAKKEIKYAT